MKTTNRKIWFGALLFSLGVGCGTADGTPSVVSDVLAITGSDVSGEQLALPDGDGAGAKDKCGRVQRSELDRLTSLLGLTAEQITQLQPILDATRAALEDLRAQVKAGTLSPADARTQVKVLHEQQKVQILALLTAEQQAKFNQMRDHHVGPFDITRLAEVLGLSADQVSEISDLSTASQAKINDVHAQVEAGTLSGADAHTQIDQILKETRGAIEAVLTAEQQAQLAKILASRPGPGRGPKGRR